VQFDKLAASFGHLGQVTVGIGAMLTTFAIQPRFQALIALTALPSKWETQITIITLNNNLRACLAHGLSDAFSAKIFELFLILWAVCQVCKGPGA